MTDEAAPPVLSEVRDGVATITLNRPGAANALSRELVGGLGQALSRARAHDGVRAVVLTGAGGKAFCAGADLKERRAMTLEETRSFLGALNAVVDAVAAFPRPVIAALNGAAFGGGLELALACDFRLAADTAELGLVETRLGIIPGAGGTQRLARVAGLAVAKELILTGRRIGAARARELGVVSEVVPAAALTAAAARLAAELAGAGPLAVAQAKRAIDGGFDLPMPEALAHERACYEIVLASADRDEGLSAFAEKRPPQFTGK
ncbi:MAG TPA: enoyl-CoA hydratase-related protein [Polyangia bacterium]|jgi:enoyl-CoA hydratase/carnithine racemase